MNEYFILDLIIGVIFTWGLGLAPALVIRKLVVKKPLKVWLAIIIMFTSLFFHLVLAVGIYEFAEVEQTSHNALTLPAMVSFLILVSGKKIDNNHKKTEKSDKENNN